MDLMGEYIAHAVMHARLVDADERRARRRRRGALVRHWWSPRTSLREGSARPTMAVAAAPPVRPPSIEVARILTAAAYRVEEHGTASERCLLEAMAEVSAATAPGAAAALVDRSGSEASRQRAFGLVHAHVVEVLGPREHAWLLDLVEGAGDAAAPDRVA